MKKRNFILMLMIAASLGACGLKRNLELPGGSKRSQPQQEQPASTTSAAPAPAATSDVTP